MLAGVTVFDTTAARYVWEWPHYPQYYVPLRDVREGVLIDVQRPSDAGLDASAVLGAVEGAHAAADVEDDRGCGLLQQGQERMGDADDADAHQQHRRGPLHAVRRAAAQ